MNLKKYPFDTQVCNLKILTGECKFLDSRRNFQVDERILNHQCHNVSVVRVEFYSDQVKITNFLLSSNDETRSDAVVERTTAVDVRAFDEFALLVQSLPD